MARRSRKKYVHADHLEWMRLVEITGPFLSGPVLSEVLPQGMAADDREVRVHLQQAHEEWHTARDDTITVTRAYQRLKVVRLAGGHCWGSTHCCEHSRHQHPTARAGTRPPAPRQQNPSQTTS